MTDIETVDTADREIVLSRVLDAPRELVFQAYTDPRHLGKWWGPRGFTTTTHEVDVREGGLWRFTMHGPDGTDYPNRIRYREITAPERLVFLLDADDDSEAPYEMTVTFADRGGKTELTQRMVLPTVEERDRVVGFGAVELGHQTLEKLAELLATLSGGTDLSWEPAGGGRDLVIRRVLAAPREAVFQAWTDPELFARWFGPRGTTLPRCEIDARPGGRIHFCHSHADGSQVWIRGVYQEVVEPERLVLDVGFSDETGDEVERPGFPTGMMRMVVTLAGTPAGTVLTIRQSGLERDQGEVEGWVETIDRLVELLA